MKGREMKIPDWMKTPDWWPEAFFVITIVFIAVFAVLVIVIDVKRTNTFADWCKAKDGILFHPYKTGPVCLKKDAVIR